MAYQNVFKRYELKYLVTEEQKAAVLAAMGEYIRPDKYGLTSVRSVYFDTPDYALIRRSLERPAYKEKLRIRSYGKADASSPVFLELKKKYNSIVYKRRVCLPLCDAENVFFESFSPKTQIEREIEYFIKFYGSLAPRAYISCERTAFCGKDDDLRITFDKDILARTTDLSLRGEPRGTALLPSGRILMEIKCSGGMYLALAKTLSGEKIYKSSFSKYGEAYQRLIYNNNFRGHLIAENAASGESRAAVNIKPEVELYA